MVLVVQKVLEGVEAASDAQDLKRFVSQRERHVKAAHAFNEHLQVHKVVGEDARGKLGAGPAGLQCFVGDHEAPRVAYDRSPDRRVERRQLLHFNGWI